MGESTWFKFSEGCLHRVEYWAVDCLGNEGAHITQFHYVDVETPTGSWEFIGPYIRINDIDYITHVTIKKINMTDRGCNIGGAGLAKIVWSVSNDTEVIAFGEVRDGYDDSYNDGVVVVTGDNDPDCGEVEINVSMKKTAAQIANDIKKRFLPEYEIEQES